MFYCGLVVVFLALGSNETKNFRRVEVNPFALFAVMLIVAAVLYYIGPCVMLFIRWLWWKIKQSGE
jgi:formate hydrogenlyase subunit 4